MKHSLILFIAICLMQLCVLTNITLLNGEWNGITLWLCTGIFIFACTIFGLSRKESSKK